MTSSELENDNLKLRKLLAFAIGGSNLYLDDGEFQDGSQFPIIDFIRDSVEEIEKSIHRRNEIRYQKLVNKFRL